MEASRHITSIHSTTGSTAGTHVSRVALIALAVLVLALVPRVLGLGDYVTIDEASKWFGRSERFLEALRTGELADTNQTGHPGVTTMWLGSGGLLIHEWLTGMGRVAPDDLAAYRVLLRLPAALVTSLCVALGYLLLRRLLDVRVALLAALLWATEPFLVAHGQVLHLDGLLTSFVMVSLLAVLVALAGQVPRADRPAAVRWGWLALSGLFGGLALLTKSPSVILLPMLGLIVLVSSWRTQRQQLGQLMGRVIAQATLLLLVWAGIALGTWVLMWPAVWVEPSAAVMSVVDEVRDNGGEPHNTGNFFLGQTIDDPGPLFYPVAVALRLTPWTSLGLLLALVALFQSGRTAWHTHERPVNDTNWFVPSMLAVFVVLFALMMSIPPKKFDRYMLPVFPALTIFAAMGWVWLLTRWNRRGNAHNQVTPPVARRELSPGLWALVVAGLVANLAWYHPYFFAYYNPLLGGGPVAARTIPVGWGEGYEQAGAFISAQFNGCDKPVASWFSPVLRHFVCSDVVPLQEFVDTPREVGYAVLYIDQLQRRNEPRAIEQLYGSIPPLHVVKIHGIEYAYVYQVEPPVARPINADFGEAIRLRGYDLDTAAVRSSRTLTLTLDWQVRAPMDTDYMLFVHVLDAQGSPVAQVDVPPNHQGAPTSRWQPDRYVTLTQPVPVPADLPDGPYWISIGLYDPQNFARLPLRGPVSPDAPYDGPHALPLGPFVLR